MQHLEQLTLVLVQPLDHDIEQRSGVYFHPGQLPHKSGQILFVLLFDLAPGLPELRVIGVGLELRELLQVAQPSVADARRDQLGQAGIRQPHEAAGVTPLVLFWNFSGHSSAKS